MKVVKFIPNSHAIDKSWKQPVPIKSLVPDWYVNAERYYKTAHGEEAPGLKTCAPFLDGLISGYALVTPEDIFVSRDEDGNLKIEWASDSNPVGERKGVSGSTMPRPAGHEQNHLIWPSKWGWKTPKGYSSLVTHPLNRFDLPFTTMSAIVDTDEYPAWGNVPFFIKSGFEGVIPAGTPYAQIIPIKRNSWTYAQDWTSSDKVQALANTTRSGKGVFNTFLGRFNGA